MEPTGRDDHTTAFVLGGGGRWGAVQVGMLRALYERGITPGLVLGTSVGAMNGAMFAADPTLRGIGRIHRTWIELQENGMFSTSAFGQVRTLLRHRTALHTTGEMRQTVERSLPIHTFEELPVSFQCNAACIEDTRERWFETGSLIDAVLASSAVPGMLPPVELAGRHYYDGGLVNSIAVDRAISLGATRIHVLHVGRIEQPLRPPSKPHEPALIAFEISRRHRLAETLAALPPNVEVHVLPSGHTLEYDDPRQLRMTDLGSTDALIEAAYEATVGYLDEEGT